MKLKKAFHLVLGHHIARRFCALTGLLALAGRLLADTGTTNILDGVTNNVAGSFTLGDTGPFNFLLITNAAALTNTSSQIGNATTAFSNLAIVTGPGSVWQSDPVITIGVSGSSNQLYVLDSAKLLCRRDIALGRLGTSMGNRLEILGGGTRAAFGGSLVVGGAGSMNRLLASGGAWLSTASAEIGQSCVARDNLAMITGFGTVWSNGLLEVGFCSTNNQLVVSNGAQVIAGLVRSSVQGGVSNTVTVTGASALLRAAGDLVIGNSGQFNSLRIVDGGRVEGRNDRIGLGGGGNLAWVSGTGTTWTNLSLTIGDSTPSNQLTAAESASIASGGVLFGAGAKSGGNTASLSGAGTRWAVGADFILGGLGSSNRVFVTDGAGINSRNVYLGGGTLVNPTALFNSDGNSLSLDGTNTKVNTASNLFVGAFGRWNRLEIRNGAQLEDRDGIVGWNGASNSVLVTGAGSVWNNTNSLRVGSNGSYSSLVISNGGFVQSGTASLDSRSGQVLITGPGSLWLDNGPLRIGAVSNSIVLSNAGVLAAQFLIIGVSNVATALVDGGCLAVSNASGTAELEVRYGQLTVQSGLVVADRLLATNPVYGRLAFNGGTLRVREGLVVVPGSFLKIGDDDHVASLVIGGGTLIVKTLLNMGFRSVLTGGGLVDAAVFTAGTTAPGRNGAGSLTVGLFGMSGNGSLDLDIGGRVAGVDYDQLVVLGDAEFAGRLDVRLRGGFTPTSNDVFQVVRFGTSDGGFTNLSPDLRVFTVDRLGSFRVDFSAADLALTDYQSTDLDGDGIEDAWASTHFGHSPLTPAERSADSDGDGASNYDEFRAGTNPEDASSVFKAAILYEKGRATVSFTCVPGKTYRLWVGATPNSFTEVIDPAYAYLSPDESYWTDDGKSTGGLGGTTRFYRMTVE